MIVVGVDPGPELSGVVEYDGDRGSVLSAEVMDTQAIIRDFGPGGAVNRPPWGRGHALLAVEYPQVFGGSGTYQAVVDTAYWAGRIAQAWSGPLVLISRGQVCVALGRELGVTIKGDAAVKAALRELVGDKGRKAAPGPTYGVKSHAWDALAVAYVAALQERDGALKP